MVVRKVAACLVAGPLFTSEDGPHQPVRRKAFQPWMARHHPLHPPAAPDRVSTKQNNAEDRRGEANRQEWREETNWDCDDDEHETERCEKLP